MLNPIRPALLAAAGSPRMEAAITTVPATKKLVDRFVAGATLEQAALAAAAIIRSGRAISIDYLGEHTTDRAQADATVSAYLALLASVGEFDAPAHSLEVSLKLSALGQALPVDGEKIALDNAREIASAAASVGATITVDAEDHTTTDSTLGIVTELRQDFPTAGTVLQAYLRRTEADCRDLSGPGSRIRLCKGAYKEPESVAFPSKGGVDASYIRCLGVLMNGHGYPMVASHDPAMISAAGALVQQTGRSAADYEYQMLHGIRVPEQERIAATGSTMRVYLPYGSAWYGYFMRRLAERPANLTFFLRSLVSR